MTILSNKRKYILPTIAVCILIVLLVGAFYALMFGKNVFQQSIGGVDGGGSTVVKFDFQRMQGLSGILQQ